MGVIIRSVLNTVHCRKYIILNGDTLLFSFYYVGSKAAMCGRIAANAKVARDCIAARMPEVKSKPVTSM